MKTEPTDIDREAATLFTPSPGMRVMHEIAHVVRPASHKGREVCEMRPAWVRIVTARDAGTCRAFAVEGNATVGRRAYQMEYFVARASMFLQAIDTDDPATVGCMLAQVEDAAGARVDLVWQWSGKGVVEWRAQWQRDDDIGVGRSGPTRGEALVAAMKAINESKGDK